jgi:hypothetical protein
LTAQHRLHLLNFVPPDASKLCELDEPCAAGLLDDFLGVITDREAICELIVPGQSADQGRFADARIRPEAPDR